MHWIALGAGLAVMMVLACQPEQTQNQTATPVSLSPTSTLMSEPITPVIRLTEDARTGVQAVAISTSIKGAAVRYTTDGSDPSPTRGMSYEGPIPVTLGVTVKAIAYTKGVPPSPISMASYPKVEPLSHSSEGTYVGPQEIDLSTTTEGASIRYTTDGSNPTLESAVLYGGPIHIADITTIKAIAFKEGEVNSDVDTLIYTIVIDQLDRPQLSLTEAIYIGPQNLTITGETGASIRYTTDGSDPTPTSGVLYQGPVAFTETATLKAITYKGGWVDSQVVASTYRIFGRKVVNEDPIILQGNNILEIVDTYYVHQNNITLRDNAQLVIRDSLVLHQKEFAFQYSLIAEGNSTVTVENSEIGNSCTGSLNWNFFETSSLVARNVSHYECNTWNFLSGESVISVNNWPYIGATVCDNSDVIAENSHNMEIEMCFPEGSTIDTVLPAEISDFSFSGEDDATIGFNLRILNSSIDGWGINLLPGSSITIRDTPAVTVGIIVGLPWTNQTVVLDDLGRKLYEDRTWDIVDATLHLINTNVYGWEPNAFASNILVIRNSDVSGSSTGNNATIVYENSTMGQVVAGENIDFTVRDSIVTGDVIATDNGRITLINSVVGSPPAEEGDTPLGNVIAFGSGTIILTDTVVHGEMITMDDGEIIEQ